MRTFFELEQLCPCAYDKIIGLKLENIVIDGYIGKRPVAVRLPDIFDSTWKAGHKTI